MGWGFGPPFWVSGVAAVFWLWSSWWEWGGEVGGSLLGSWQLGVGLGDLSWLGGEGEVVGGEGGKEGSCLYSVVPGRPLSLGVFFLRVFVFSGASHGVQSNCLCSWGWVGGCGFLHEV